MYIYKAYYCTRSQARFVDFNLYNTILVFLQAINGRPSMYDILSMFCIPGSDQPSLQYPQNKSQSANLEWKTNNQICKQPTQRVNWCNYMMSILHSSNNIYLQCFHSQFNINRPTFSSHFYGILNHIINNKIFCME